MARLSHVVLIIAMNVLMCVLAVEETYPKEYEKFDVQAVLKNDDLRKEYLKCFLKTAPCKTPEMKTMSEHFGKAIQTECKKCTEKQNELTDLTKDWYIKNRPEIREKWQQIVAKFAENTKKKNIESTTPQSASDRCKVPVWVGVRFPPVIINIC